MSDFAVFPRSFQLEPQRLFRFWLLVRNLVSSVCIALLLGLTSAAVHAEDGVYWIIYPYDGSSPPFPNDRSRTAFGNTPAETCAARTDYELTGGSNQQLVFVGLLTGNPPFCGYQWQNGSVVVTVPVDLPRFKTCSQFNDDPPDWPRPAICSLSCPPEQRDATGHCLVSTDINAGPPCEACEAPVANPINPGTGNKYQAETDIADAGGQLRFVRHYNSGVQAVNFVFAGWWTHTYNSRVLIDDLRTHVTYVRSDGRRFHYTLQSGAWTADAKNADTLVEIKDVNGQTTGWQLSVATTDDLEIYDGWGNLTAIETRSGLRQSLTYSDGTNGANGGVILDSSGLATTQVLPKRFLIRVTDQFGRSLKFGYDAFYRIKKITDPAGGGVLYTYDTGARGNLLTVSYPDGHYRSYVYNEPANVDAPSKPFALTGIIDENQVRFATYKYDTYGRAKESLHDPDGTAAEHYVITYDTPGSQTSVTDPLGKTRQYMFQARQGMVKNSGVSEQAAGALGSSVDHDANGSLSVRIDWNNNRTNYDFDPVRNLELSRTEGLTAQNQPTDQKRTITTQWHPNFRLPVQIAEPLRRTTFIYNGDQGITCGLKADNTTPVPGVLCRKTVQATTDVDGSLGFGATATGSPRVWNYAYNRFGQVLSVDGPRTDVNDVTNFDYYSDTESCPTTYGGHATGCRGKLRTSTNALGHVTQFAAYDAVGYPLAVIDPNGLVTRLTYDSRQRLKRRDVGGEFTDYDYDGVGQLITITPPGGASLTYGYDNAHRLTRITDKDGNYVEYTNLDGMGNRRLERVHDVNDAGTAFAQVRTRVFDTLNRLFQDKDSQGHPTEYTYDAQGNVKTVKPPLHPITTNDYDALNRLKEVTDAAGGHTKYSYNGLDALTKVTDPTPLDTTYTVDGLGNLNQQLSPDTGMTSNTYDAAGNLQTATDAKNQKTEYEYDALNRLTLVTVRDSSTAIYLKQIYGYDEAANAKGRLSSITETDASDQVIRKIAYTYDPHGRVKSDTRTVAGAQHTTTSSGRLSDMTYPTGRSVTLQLRFGRAH